MSNKKQNKGRKTNVEKLEGLVRAARSAPTGRGYAAGMAEARELAATMPDVDVAVALLVGGALTIVPPGKAA